MTDMDALMAAAGALAESGKNLVEQAAHVRLGAAIRRVDITEAALNLGPLVDAYDETYARYRAAREAVTRGTPPAFATSA